MKNPNRKTIYPQQKYSEMPVIEETCKIPHSVLRHLRHLPPSLSVVFLLRHSVREELPRDDPGLSQPITTKGRTIALELGKKLRGRLKTLRTSPALRCIQTAEALRDGAGVNLAVVQDTMLGVPGAYIANEKLAWENWKQHGNKTMMKYLSIGDETLPGLINSNKAAQHLVQHMFSKSGGRSGIHVFVSHDALLMPTAARFIGESFAASNEDMPEFLDGAFFWKENECVHVSYHEHQGVRKEPLLEFIQNDAI